MALFSFARLNLHRPSRWLGLAACALLIAVLLVSASPAEGQGPPEWVGSVLTLSPDSVVVLGGNWSCARWNDESPQAFRILNQEFELYGICGRGLPGGALDNFEVHFPRGQSLSRVGSLPLEYVRWEYTSTQNVIYSDKADPPQFLSDTGILSDRFTGQPTTVLSSTAHCNTSSFGCQQTYGVTSSSETVITIRFSGDLTSGTPAVPSSVSAARSDDFDEITVSWDLHDPVSLYEVEREENTASEGQGTTWGNATTESFTAGIAGVDEYEDTGLEPDKDYRYRVAARGASFSAYSSWAVSNKEADTETEAPSNIQVHRGEDKESVDVMWSAPDAVFDGYSVQRQELTESGSSTFFSNRTTLGGKWIAMSATTYTDSAIIPSRTYEYRVAAVKDDMVGEYSDWARTAPLNRSYGEAPPNLRLDDSTARDDRREYWLVWDEVDGTTDYELERFILSPDGRQTVTPGIIVTEPMHFQTGYTLNRWRVRGRKSDTDLCGSGTDDYCYTGWTGWFQVGFQPLHKVDTPLEATESTRSTAMQAEVDEFHTSVVSFVEDTMSISGVTVDGQGILNTGVMVAGVIPAGIATWRGRRTGMIGIGMGGGVAYFVMTLALGVRLLELPVSWIIVSVMVVLVGGGLAAVKVLGLFGRGS